MTRMKMNVFSPRRGVRTAASPGRRPAHTVGFLEARGLGVLRALHRPSAYRRSPAGCGLGRSKKWHKPLLLALLLAVAGSPLEAATPSSRIEKQKQVVAALERKIAQEEREIARLKKDRAATQEQVRRLALQIESRDQLLDETEHEARLLREEIGAKNGTTDSLALELAQTRERYAELVREAYRNYRRNDFLTFLFSSRDFADAARRIALLREAAAMRARKMERITQLAEQLRIETEELDRRRQSLEAVSRKLTAQREALRRDANHARAALRTMSQKEKAALQQKLTQQRQLQGEVDKLRKLVKNNTAGASFSARTSGLRLPVRGGRVKRYRENIAEITGPKGAQAIAIYEGRVMDIKRNRITDKYEVYVAHGQYLTSYANLGTIRVEKGQKVARDQVLGTIGAAVDAMTMQTEHKLVFGIYPPDPQQKVLAENCFKTKK